jgi:hypothetical protein
MSKKTIGSCGICGGAVTVPDPWWGVVPPTPTCEECGAEAAPPGPVIPMRPRRRRALWVGGTYMDFAMAPVRENPPTKAGQKPG